MKAKSTPCLAYQIRQSENPCDVGDKLRILCYLINLLLDVNELITEYICWLWALIRSNGMD